MSAVLVGAFSNGTIPTPLPVVQWNHSIASVPRRICKPYHRFHPPHSQWYEKSRAASSAVCLWSTFFITFPPRCPCDLILLSSLPSHHLVIFARTQQAQILDLPIQPNISSLVRPVAFTGHLFCVVGVRDRELCDFNEMVCITQTVFQCIFRGTIRQVVQVLFPAGSEGLIADFHATCTSESRIPAVMMKSVKAPTRGFVERRVQRERLCPSFTIARVQVC